MDFYAPVTRFFNECVNVDSEDLRCYVDPFRKGVYGTLKFSAVREKKSRGEMKHPRDEKPAKLKFLN